MPYAEAFDPALPNGNENADLIDNQIRSAKAALIERFLSALGANLQTDDPLRVIKVIVPSGATGLRFRNSTDSATLLQIADAGISAITVPASAVTPGTFPVGDYTLQGDITLTAGRIRGHAVTQTGAGGTIDFSVCNHVRHTMTGSGNITFSGGEARTAYTLELLQDGVGGRVPTFTNAVWDNGAAPTFITTANRKAIFSVFYDGSSYCVGVFGLNFASSA